MNDLVGYEQPPPQPDDEILSRPVNMKVFNTVLWATRIVLHPSVAFEPGSEEEITVHRDNGGCLLLVMTHLNRLGPFSLGSAVVSHNDLLGHLPGKTGITAAYWLRKVPILGDALDECGIEWVRRGSEHQNETAEEKKIRKAQNSEKTKIGGRYLAAGNSWYIMPEGETRVEVPRNREEENWYKRWRLKGKEFERVPREQGEKAKLLPIRDGVVNLLDLLTPEQRRNLKILGVAEYYGPRVLSSFRPTLAFTKPEVPVEGDREDWRLQVHDILQRGLDLAKEHDAKRPKAKINKGFLTWLLP